MGKAITPSIKYETPENWEKAKNYIPKKGDILIYTMNDHTAKMKLGDGVHTPNDLPFIGQQEWKVESGTLTLGG